MILSGRMIGQYQGDLIKIDPWDPASLNPNSYNVHLHEELAVYADHELDMKKNHDLIPIRIPPEGLWLRPGVLYLGRTQEWTYTQGLVPMLEGRSSIGRLGMFIHVTAGFGDVGFRGFWTLEITVIQPLKIYAGVAVGQLYYHTIEGAYDDYSEGGKYQGNTGIQGSGLWKDFLK